MKPIIKIADTQFAHGTSLGSGDLKIHPKYFSWYRGNEKHNDMIVITESCFHLTDNYRETTKIAWLLEPPSISPDSYKWILQNHHKFSYILTHQKWLIERLGEKALWYSFGGCWLYPEQQQIYPKSKGISIIASSKKQTEGHKLRHEVIEKFRDRIDVYGNGYKFVESKLEALRDYRYSIIIENEQSDYFFTEKLIDCLRTGTIPIFWGRPNFNTVGFCLCFDTIEELGQIISYSTGKDSYELLAEYIQLNFEQAEPYVVPENLLWKNFFAPKIFNM